MVTVKRTFRKTLYREVRQSLSRFLAIFAIVALGVGFLAGLLATTPDMRLSMDNYFDENSLMDLRVVSTLGLTEDDCTVLRETEGVQAVMPAYNTDKLTDIDERAPVSTACRSGRTVPNISTGYSWWTGVCRKRRTSVWWSPTRRAAPALHRARSSR